MNKKSNIKHFSKVHFEGRNKNTVVLRMQIHESGNEPNNEKFEK